jgi:hypothetical protein
MKNLEVIRPSKTDAERADARRVLERGSPLSLLTDWIGGGRLHLGQVEWLVGQVGSARASAQTRSRWSLVALLLFWMNLSVTNAQLYSIDWFTVNGGGGTSTGGVYSLSGTIGQPDAGGPMTNGSFSLTGGFWVLPTAVQAAGAPTLKIVAAASNQATISWTPSTTNYVLQENFSLATTNWINSVSGATNPITVPATGPAKFYRLFRP